MARLLRLQPYESRSGRGATRHNCRSALAAPARDRALRLRAMHRQGNPAAAGSRTRGNCILEASLAKYAAAAPQDLVLRLQPTVCSAELHDLGLCRGREPVLHSIVDVGL